jgi:hypothetical protein
MYLPRAGGICAREPNCTTERLAVSKRLISGEMFWAQIPAKGLRVLAGAAPDYVVAAARMLDAEFTSFSLPKSLKPRHVIGAEMPAVGLGVLLWELPRHKMTTASIADAKVIRIDPTGSKSHRSQLSAISPYHRAKRPTRRPTVEAAGPTSSSSLLGPVSNQTREVPWKEPLNGLTRSRFSGASGCAVSSPV